MADEKMKKDEKKTPEAAETKMVKPLPPIPQNPNLRMLVIETNGTRAEVTAFTMQAQEALHILSEVATMIRQGINNAPPLHPPPPAALKIQPPAPGEAKA